MCFALLKIKQTYIHIFYIIKLNKTNIMDRKEEIYLNIILFTRIHSLEIVVRRSVGLCKLCV